MSSTTVPVLVSNRTTLAFSYFIFVFIIFILSIKKVPEFSSLTILLGLLFFTSLITVIFTVLGWLSRVQVWMSGIKTKDIWIGTDADLLVQTNTFALYMDKLTGELFFGSGTFVLGLVVMVKGNDIIEMVFGPAYVLENILSIYVLSLIGIILAIISLFIVYHSWMNGKKNKVLIWDFLALFRMRRYPRPDSLDHPFNKWIDKLFLLVQNKYFQLFHDELSSLFYLRIEKIIDDNRTLISDFLTDHDKSPSIRFGYPEFTLSIMDLFQAPHQFNKEQDNIPTKTKYLSNLFAFDILGLELQLSHILFAPNSEFNTLITDIRKKVKKLISFDYIFVHISWIYFYSCLKTEKQNSPVHKANILPIDNLDVKMIDTFDVTSITFTILYSTWLVYNSFSLEQESQNISFYYDSNDSYSWKHFKPDAQFIRLLKNNSDKMFRKLIQNIDVIINGRPVKLRDMYAELIKQFRDINKNDPSWAMVYNSSLEKLIDILEKLTYNEFLTFFQIERKVDTEKLAKSLSLLSKELDHIAKSIPWKSKQ